MGFNSSLDFLDMIKNSSDGMPPKKATTTGSSSDVKKIVAEVVNKSANIKPATTDKVIAVIDTETNWHNQVMSVGVAIADAKSFKCVDTRYYVIDPECRVGGMYSSVMHRRDLREIQGNRKGVMSDLNDYLRKSGVSKIFAYNAKFDYGHLTELSDFEWFDIMRLAAYKQYNSAIPESFECCKTGRLKTNYGVEPILRLLSKDRFYCETHNAVLDAMDELRIIELMGLEVEKYFCGKIN